MTEPQYEDYQDMVRKAAWDWCRKNTWLEFEDLVSAGNLAFCEARKTWDPDKGKFSTHLHWRMRYRMGHLNSASIRDGSVRADLDEAMEMPDDVDAGGEASFWAAVDGLGQEAREVVRLILGSSGELCDFTLRTVRVGKGNIYKFLRSLNWPQATILGAMGEIKETLRAL